MIARELVLLALLLLVVEIAGRRLALWGSLRLPPSLARRLRHAVARARKAVARPPVSEPAETLEPQGPPPEVVEATLEPRSEGLGGALTRARRAAGRKLDR